LHNGVVKKIVKLFACICFYIAKSGEFDMNLFMKRKQFTTTIKEDALKDVKKLAIDLDRSVNDLLEEAIEWLLKKYKKKGKK
jgi:antitoxin-like ribbon-helix-helix protein